ncbi:hypothetical protein DAMA08_040060 [Martiniozyma asiatica (nom. inval.)]|nr:hypothetical protein DAMA08_040060 [Martiniozyma asiatica]
MYLPVDPKIKQPTYVSFINNNILPLASTDPNLIYNPHSSLDFSLLDIPYKADVAMRIGRTPLSPKDPSTYCSISPYTEYNIRKHYSSIGGNGSTNLLDKPPQPIPTIQIGVQDEGKVETLPFGCMVNPLAADNFKQVQLTPGCLFDMIDFEMLAAVQGVTKHTNSGIGSIIFGKKSTLQNSVTDFDNIKQPKNNLLRNTSSFVDKYATCENYNKKINNSSNFMFAAHGRMLNFIALSDNPANIDVDPPILKVTLASSVITCISTFSYITSSGERNIDVVIGMANGDILWINPIKMRYTRWNKGGRLINFSVMSICWSNTGHFIVAGFSNGEFIILGRDFEDPDTYKKRCIKKSQFMKTYSSFISNSSIYKNLQFAHFRCSKKAITAIKFHPIFSNLLAMTSNDGYVRIFDILTEKFIDLAPSYYAGLLCCEFSNDGRYLFAGGQDDNVSIFEFQYSQPNLPFLKHVSRLIGSKSWIKNINVSYLSTSLRYVISAVGDDGILRVWEVEPRQNRRKKFTNAAPTNMTHNISSSNIFNSNLLNRSPHTASSLKKKNHRHNSPSVSSLASWGLGESNASTGVAKSKSIFEVLNGKNSSQGLMMSPLPSKNSLLDYESRPNGIKHKLFSDKSSRIFVASCETFIHPNKSFTDIINYQPIVEKDLGLGRISWVDIRHGKVWCGFSSGDVVRWVKV